MLFSESYIWRSITWGKEIIKEGIRWCIGNGQSILVYDDRRVPRPSMFKIVSLREMPADSLVADLFLLNGEWDIGLLLTSFFLLMWKPF